MPPIVCSVCGAEVGEGEVVALTFDRRGVRPVFGNYIPYDPIGVCWSHAHRPHDIPDARVREEVRPRPYYGVTFWHHQMSQHSHTIPATTESQHEEAKNSTESLRKRYLWQAVPARRSVCGNLLSGLPTTSLPYPSQGKTGGARTQGEVPAVSGGLSEAAGPSASRAASGGARTAGGGTPS